MTATYRIFLDGLLWQIKPDLVRTIASWDYLISWLSTTGQKQAFNLVRGLA
jgi:hypothetical protein